MSHNNECEEMNQRDQAMSMFSNDSPSSSSLSSSEFTTGSGRLELGNMRLPRQGIIVATNDSIEGDDLERRRTVLLKAYDTEVKTKMNKNKLCALKGILRKVVIPNVKFVGDSKSLGSFEKPDFTSEDCWQNELFKKIPCLANLTDKEKVINWKTYKTQLKMEFGNVRGVVTKKIKMIFMNSK